jgi:hypothetical protein
VKILMRVMIGIVILGVVLVLARNQIIKAGAGATIKSISGVDMKIGTLDIGLFRPAVLIKDLKLFNPAAFPEKLMMDMPELYVKYDLPSIMKGAIHLSELKVDLKEFVVVKTPEGAININSLKALQPPKGEGKPPQIQIDIMELNIGTVVYKEYKAGAAPRVTEFKINLHERYENISDPNVLVGLIVSKALRNTTISGISGTLKNADKLVGGAAGLVIQSGTKVTKDALKAADTVVGTTTKTLANTLDKLIGQ